MSLESWTSDKFTIDRAMVAVIIRPSGPLQVDQFEFLYEIYKFCQICRND
jgi:hypothetical protein